jgi:hypothetical protein
MKKIFTLLFCVTAMSFASQAANNYDAVQRCINYLLGLEQPMTLMATNLDANHDGDINIEDVTTLIDMDLEANQPAMAPAQEVDVEAVIKDMLDNEPPTPTIDDVTDTIEKKLNK